MVEWPLILNVLSNLSWEWEARKGVKDPTQVFHASPAGEARTLSTGVSQMHPSLCLLKIEGVMGVMD
jgi:hypothetical protein